MQQIVHRVLCLHRSGSPESTAGQQKSGKEGAHISCTILQLCWHWTQEAWSMPGGTGCWGCPRVAPCVRWSRQVSHHSPHPTPLACILAASSNKPGFLNSTHATNRVWCSKTQFKADWTQTGFVLMAFASFRLESHTSPAANLSVWVSWLCQPSPQ